MEKNGWTDFDWGVVLILLCLVIVLGPVGWVISIFIVTLFANNENWHRIVVFVLMLMAWELHDTHVAIEGILEKISLVDVAG